MKDTILVSTRSNTELSEKIARRLGIDLCEVNIKDFADSEISVEVLDSIRRKEVFVMAGTSTFTNKNNDIMELMLLIDAIRRSSPSRITVVFPYFYYARQDRRVNRSPISSRVIANMLVNSGINAVVCVDLHALQIQGYFSNNVICEHLSVFKIIRDHVKYNGYECVVSADVGGTARARYFSKLLDLPLAIIDKRRTSPGVSQVMNVIGDVNGKKCCIVDDMIDGGGTVCGAADALLDSGATSVDVAVVHGVFSGEARKKIQESNINKVYVTDSIEQSIDIFSDKIEIVSVDVVLSETIKRVRNGQSVKALEE